MATHTVLDEALDRCRSPLKLDIHTRCKTQEGVYSVICMLDSSKNLKGSISNSVQSSQSLSTTTVKISRPLQEGLGDLDNLACDLFCLNYGYELFVYKANANSKPGDLLKLIDSKSFHNQKIYPTSHDFRPFPAKPKSQSLQYYKQRNEIPNYELLIGMSNGQIYLADQNYVKKIFNMDHQIEGSRVTCLKWVPSNTNHFVVGHQSGFLYTYDVEKSSSTLPLPARPMSLYQSSSNAPGRIPAQVNSVMYQIFKASKGLRVYNIKSSLKISLSSGQQHINPVYKWCFDANLPINDLVFSPCKKYLSVACQDGYLRIIDYDKLEMKSALRSYFGGLRCISWSSDSHYLATGGDDDMITVFSLLKDTVLCRCVGHKSRINAVVFDSFVISNGLSVRDAGSLPNGRDCNFIPNNFQKPQELSGSLKDNTTRSNFDIGESKVANNSATICNHKSGIIGSPSGRQDEPASDFYRLISVADDTFVCFWDLNINELSGFQFNPTETQIKENLNLERETNMLPINSTCSDVPCNGIITKHFFPLKFSKIASKKGIKHNPTCSSSNGTSMTSRESRPSVGRGDKRPSKTHPQKFASLSIFDQRKRDKEMKRSTSAAPPQRFATVTGSEFGLKNRISPHTNLSSNLNSSTAVSAPPCDQILISLGSRHCPRLSEVPLVEPLVCKKVSHDRLISLSLDADHIFMSSQDGCLFIWTRPIFAVKL